MVAVERNAPEQPAVPRNRWHTMRADVKRYSQAVRDSDQELVDETVTRLSRARPWLAPLALAVGAFAMLFDGVKLLFTNWRFTLIQVLPAMWIWAALLDLKAQLLHDKAIHDFASLQLALLVLACAAITAASFYLNAVFAFAISPGRCPGMRRGHRASSWRIGLRRLRLGRIVLVHRLDGHRHLGDDDLLRRRAVPARRHQDHSYQA